MVAPGLRDWEAKEGRREMVMRWGEKDEEGGGQGKDETRFSTCEGAELTGKKPKSWEEDLVYKNKKRKEKKSQSLREVEEVKGATPSIHLLCFCCLAYAR